MITLSSFNWPKLIVELMAEHGVSQRRFTKDTGVSRTTLRHWLKGRHSTLSIAHLETMLDYFGYDLKAIRREGA